MSLLMTDLTVQLIAWFIALFYTIIGLYCLVINFGQLLNRFVFLFAVSVALRYFCIGLLVTIPDGAQAAWLNGPTRLLSAVQEPLLVIMTLILLKPRWWRGRQRWRLRPVIGLSLILPLLILSDILFKTQLYYGGVSPITYTGGYMTTAQSMLGDFFLPLSFIHLVLIRLIIFTFAVYVAWFDPMASARTRRSARLILGSVTALMFLTLIPRDFLPELPAVVLVGVVGPIGFVSAIFLQIFSEQPFQKGSLQTRLLAVVLATTIPILIAVGLLARQSEQAFWSGLIFGVVILCALIQLTIRYSIRSIHLLTQTATAITAGDLRRTATVETKDEIGLLAAAFNSMTEQLRGLILELEQRVASRTRELERRAVQLETTGRIGQYIISILDQETLLAEVVELIQLGFGYDFVGVWLVTPDESAMALRAQARSANEQPPTQPLTLAADDPALVVEVWQQGASCLIDRHGSHDPWSLAQRLPEAGSVLVLPLLNRDQVSGVLEIRCQQPAVFEYGDQVVFQMLADEVAIALQNAQLYQTEQNRRRLAEALQQVSRELSSSLDMRQVPGLILEQLALAVPYERCALMLQRGPVLHVVAQRGFPQGERALTLQIQIHEGDIYQQIAQSGGPVRLDNVTQDPTWQQVEWLPVNLSWLGVPLSSKDRLIGMISLTRPEANAFSQEDASLVSAFSGHAAIALENARLYDEIIGLNEGLERTVAQRTEELNLAYHTLERLDKTKSDFINIMAHELRTPLTIIRGYAQVLSNVELGVNHDFESREMLAGVLTGVERLQEIVDSMLDVAKIESQALNLHKEATTIEAIVQQVRDRLAEALRERRLALSATELQHLPSIQADPDLLYKVFYHLLVNAVKYVPDGGSIIVSGRVVSENGGGPKVEVVVSDTGIGIHPADHHLIFEKFYQTGEVAVHSSGRTKFKGGGPGLGLAIVQGIVSAHRGQIWVESAGYNEETCPGSHFYVRLPLL